MSNRSSENQEAVNTFVGGLNKDLNPLTTPANVLTDALNATILTYDGNEYLLQNDMGNAPIIYKNIEGEVPTEVTRLAQLPNGYIPVAIKELNEIFYIVALKQDLNGEGQGLGTYKTCLGTFPAPGYAVGNQETESQQIPSHINGTSYVTFTNIELSEYASLNLLHLDNLVLPDDQKLFDWYTNELVTFKINNQDIPVYETENINNESQNIINPIINPTVTIEFKDYDFEIIPSYFNYSDDYYEYFNSNLSNISSQLWLDIIPTENNTYITDRTLLIDYLAGVKVTVNDSDIYDYPFNNKVIYSGELGVGNDIIIKSDLKEYSDITLIANGIDSLAIIINNWNVANPDRNVNMVLGDDSEIPTSNIILTHEPYFKLENLIEISESLLTTEGDAEEITMKFQLYTIFGTLNTVKEITIKNGKIYSDDLFKYTNSENNVNFRSYTTGDKDIERLDFDIAFNFESQLPKTITSSYLEIYDSWSDVSMILDDDDISQILKSGNINIPITKEWEKTDYYGLYGGVFDTLLSNGYTESDLFTSDTRAILPKRKNISYFSGTVLGNHTYITSQNNTTITLTANGTSLATLISVHNLANPTNLLTLVNGVGTDIPVSNIVISLKPYTINKTFIQIYQSDINFHLAYNREYILRFNYTFSDNSTKNIFKLLYTLPDISITDMNSISDFSESKIERLYMEVQNENNYLHNIIVTVLSGDSLYNYNSEITNYLGGRNTQWIVNEKTLSIPQFFVVDEFSSPKKHYIINDFFPVKFYKATDDPNTVGMYKNLQMYNQYRNLFESSKINLDYKLNSPYNSKFRIFGESDNLYNSYKSYDQNVINTLNNPNVSKEEDNSSTSPLTSVVINKGEHDVEWKEYNSNGIKSNLLDGITLEVSSSDLTHEFYGYDNNFNEIPLSAQISTGVLENIILMYPKNYKYEYKKNIYGDFIVDGSYYINKKLSSLGLIDNFISSNEIWNNLELEINSNLKLNSLGFNTTSLSDIEKNKLLYMLYSNLRSKEIKFTTSGTLETGNTLDYKDISTNNYFRYVNGLNDTKLKTIFLQLYTLDSNEILSTTTLVEGEHDIFVSKYPFVHRGTSFPVSKSVYDWITIDDCSEDGILINNNRYYGGDQLFWDGYQIQYHTGLDKRQFYGLANLEYYSEFNGQVAGMTTDVVIRANNPGGIGVLNLLDNGSNINTLISTWNAANVGREITLVSGDGTQIPTADIKLRISGGAIFEGQVSGMTTDIIISADKITTDYSPELLIVSDSVKTINQLISEYNYNNPNNTIYLSLGNGSQIPTAQILLIINDRLTFNGQVAGMTTDVVIAANNYGISNQSPIVLTGNGVNTINTLISNWNAVHSSQYDISLISGIGTQIPNNGETITLDFPRYWIYNNGVLVTGKSNEKLTIKLTWFSGKTYTNTYTVA